MRLIGVLLFGQPTPAPCLLTPKRCSKKPRRLATRLLPRHTSFWGTYCPVTCSPNRIGFAARCTSVTCGLELMVKWPQEGVCIHGLLSKTALSYISSQSSLLTRPKSSGSTYSRWCAKPQRATVHQHILWMGVLNDYVRYLLMVKDSPKAVPMMKKGKIPFGKADLAAIVSASVLMTWLNC